MSPVPEQEENREKPPPVDGGIEDAEYPDVIINAGSSSEDEDGFDGYVGYQALSQDGVENDSDEEEEDEDPGEAPDAVPTFQEEEQDFAGIQVPMGVVEGIRHENYPNVPNLPSYLQVPDAPRPDKSDLLWNQPRSGGLNMDTGHADKIKTVMANIHLPACNIPDWAKSLSDDQWQSNIVNKLVKKCTSQEKEVSDVSQAKCLSKASGNMDIQDRGKMNGADTTLDSQAGPTDTEKMTSDISTVSETDKV